MNSVLARLDVIALTTATVLAVYKPGSQRRRPRLGA
jgi:hypothetical protein